MFWDIDKYHVGLEFHNWQMGHTSPTTYSVTKDDRLLKSIHSLSEVDTTPAYKVELSREYSNLDEASAASEAIYADTSIVRSYAADKYSDQASDTERSLAAYLHAENPESSKKGQVDAFWSGFQSDATYQKFAAQGGTKNENDVEELLAAAESYRWQKSYAEKGVYAEDMFAFADKLKENTGVSVITRGTGTSMQFTMNDKIAITDNFTFQIMAKHQDHMDLWEKAVSGGFKSFNEMSEAVHAVGDESLNADWDASISSGPDYHSEPTTDFAHIREAEGTIMKYAKATTKRDTLYDSQIEGTTAKDFWNEFRFNTGLSNEFSSKRDIHDMVNNYFGGFASTLDDILLGQSGETRYTTVKTEDKLKGSEARIAALRDKIKDVRKKMSVLQGVAAMTETQTRQLDGYKKQMASYEQQIATIQTEELREKLKDR